MLTRLFPLALICAGAACGETPVDPLSRIVPVPAGQSASASIGAAGGVVELVSSDGARFRLDVPVGALDSATIITLSTSAASRPQRFVLRFAPEGLDLSVPATVTVELPSAHALAATGTLTYNSVPLAVDRPVGGGIRASVRRFASLHHFLSDVTASAMPHTSPEPPPCAGWYDHAAFVRGGLVAVDEMAITTYGDCAALRIDEVMATGEYGEAVRLSDATDALLQRAAQDDAGAPGDWVGFIRTRSCHALGFLNARLSDPPVAMFGYLRPRLGGAYFVARHVESVGGSCAALGESADAVARALDLLVAFYATREGAITSIATSEYENAVNEARAGADLLRELSLLGTSADLMIEATRSIRETAHPALLGVVLPAAIASCGPTGNRAALLRLRDIMGPLPALQSALQDCVAN